MYANLRVKLCEGINCYNSLPKHKTIIEDPDNIIQDFKTVRLGFTLQQNRYTALTSMTAQTRSWFILLFISAAVCSALWVCFLLA